MGSPKIAEQHTCMAHHCFVHCIRFSLLCHGFSTRGQCFQLDALVTVCHTRLGRSKSEVLICWCVCVYVYIYIHIRILNFLRCAYSLLYIYMCACVNIYIYYTDMCRKSCENSKCLEMVPVEFILKPTRLLRHRHGSCRSRDHPFLLHLDHVKANLSF